jgi:hypothetical protein
LINDPDPEQGLGAVSLMMDLLLPSTDGGVLIQLVVVVIVSAILISITRGKEYRLVVIGGTSFILAAMALRTLH